jgi:hypothetical protein
MSTVQTAPDTIVGRIATAAGVALVLAALALSAPLAAQAEGQTSLAGDTAASAHS